MATLGAAKTRGQILALLCGGERTAAELADAIGVSGSAIRAQLAALEREGLVTYERVIKSVGKPTHRYRLTAAGEGLLSRAYLPLTRSLLEELARRMDGRAVESLVRQVGRRLADRQPKPAGDESARARAGIELIETLGGLIEVEARPAGMTLRGKCCPVAALAQDHPQICSAVEEMLSAHTGLAVQQHCERSGRPSCRFEISFAPGGTG